MNRATVGALRSLASVCDQWQFVKDHEGDIYKEWWAGKNVHFGGAAADALGRFLADHVVRGVGN
jgi:hypothetical protein